MDASLIGLSLQLNLPLTTSKKAVEPVKTKEVSYKGLSKTRTRKCKSGLHEYMLEDTDRTSNIYSIDLFCKFCNAKMK